jgi:hypothetical protein
LKGLAEKVTLSPKGSYSYVTHIKDGVKTECPLYGPPRDNAKYTLAMQGVARWIKFLGDSMYALIMTKEKEYSEKMNADYNQNYSTKKSVMHSPGNNKTMAVIYDINVELNKIAKVYDIKYVVSPFWLSKINIRTPTKVRLKIGLK